MPNITLQRQLRRTLVGAGLGLAAALAQALPYSNLYVFGDSLSDVGNDARITGGAVPTAAIYTDGSHIGRFTNGLNYADVLAAGLGLSLTPSTQPGGGNDYAYGGARTTTIQPGLVPLGGLSFNQQISAFDATHATADPNALYLLWIGANDMSDAFTAIAQGAPINATLGAAIGTATSGIAGAITDLKNKGATHFLIPNLPDLSLIPAITSLGSPTISGLAHAASLSFNASLAATLGQAGFATLDIRPFDVLAAQTSVTGSPSTYGFSNVTSSCYTGDVDGAALPGGPAPSICGTPSTYLYWDYEHPTAALHAILGAEALAIAVPEASSWLLMSLGLAALGIASRVRRRN